MRGEKNPRGKFVNALWNVQAGGEGPEIVIAGRSTIICAFEKGAISPVLAEDYQAYPAAEKMFILINKPVAASLADPIFPCCIIVMDIITVPPQA